MRERVTTTCCLSHTLSLTLSCSECVAALGAPESWSATLPHQLETSFFSTYDAYEAGLLLCSVVAVVVGVVVPLSLLFPFYYLIERMIDRVQD